MTEDWKQIPIAEPGYKIKNGGAVRKPNGAMAEVYTSKDGYLRVAVKLKATGKISTMGIHRLLMLTFDPPDGNADKLTVNHFDRNKENNTLDNLDWMTVKENNIHAAITEDSPPTDRLVLIHEDGDVKFLPNIKTAAEFLGCTERDVWLSVMGGDPVGEFSSWEVHHYGQRTLLPEEAKRIRIPIRNASGRAPDKAVRMYDLFTEDMIEFKSMSACARFIGGSTSAVYYAMSFPNKIKLYKGRYMIHRVEDKMPELTKEMLSDVLKKGPKEVMAYNTTFRNFVIYESAAQFIRVNGLSKKAVTTRLRRGVLEEVEGWIFTYVENLEQRKKLQDMYSGLENTD